MSEYKIGVWPRALFLLGLVALLGESALVANDASGESAGLRFTDITEDAGLSAFIGVQGSDRKDHIIEVMGGGAGFLDYDADGNLDILLVLGSTIEQFPKGGDLMAALYQGDGKGHFTDVTKSAGLTKRGWGQGLAVGDHDNNGHVDIFLTGYGGNALYQNLGDGTFREVAAAAGVASSQWSLGAAFTDIDRDGDLDLYVSNYLSYPLARFPERDANCNYRGFGVFCGPRGLPGLRDFLYINDGQGHFEDVAKEYAIDEEKFYGLGVLVADYNNDSWPDIFVANDLTSNLFYQNNGDGTFEELSVLAGAAFSEDGIEEGSMGIDVADINQDGWLDLYYTKGGIHLLGPATRCRTPGWLRSPGRILLAALTIPEPCRSSTIGSRRKRRVWRFCSGFGGGRASDVRNVLAARPG